MDYTIREITVVDGWNLEGSGAALVKFDGHIAFQDALDRAADRVQVKNGAYVKVSHEVEVEGLDSWQGNTTEAGQIPSRKAYVILARTKGKTGPGDISIDSTDYDNSYAKFTNLRESGDYDAVAMYDADRLGVEGQGCIARDGIDIDLVTGVEYAKTEA